MMMKVAVGAGTAVERIFGERVDSQVYFISRKCSRHLARPRLVRFHMASSWNSPHLTTVT